jgi:hypothetical protein
MTADEAIRRKFPARQGSNDATAIRDWQLSISHA